MENEWKMRTFLEKCEQGANFFQLKSAKITVEFMNLNFLRIYFHCKTLFFK
jgi:hypothetical protein